MVSEDTTRQQENKINAMGGDEQRQQQMVMDDEAGNVVLPSPATRRHPMSAEGLYGVAGRETH